MDRERRRDAVFAFTDAVLDSGYFGSACDWLKEKGYPELWECTAEQLEEWTKELRSA